MASYEPRLALAELSYLSLTARFQITLAQLRYGEVKITKEGKRDKC